jgi:hypothetical protein
MPCSIVAYIRPRASPRLMLVVLVASFGRARSPSSLWPRKHARLRTRASPVLVFVLRSARTVTRCRAGKKQFARSSSARGSAARLDLPPHRGSCARSGASLERQTRVFSLADSRPATWMPRAPAKVDCYSAEVDCRRGSWQ